MRPPKPSPPYLSSTTTTTMRIPTLFLLGLATAPIAHAQIPLEPVWGASCLPDEQYYRDAVAGNSYFPADDLTIDIDTLGESPCRPAGLDSIDLYGEAIPFYHPITGVLLETVERKPMFKDVYRRVIFSVESTGLADTVYQDILAVELIAHSTDPLARPFVYLGTGTIDYVAIRTALQDHLGQAYDFTDSCGHDYSIDALNVDNLPAILETHPWGDGSRVVLFWRCNGPDGVKWYIQHVFINDAPYVYLCTPPGTDTAWVNGCGMDQTPPLLTDLDPLFFSCIFGQLPVVIPPVTDDFDTQPTVEFLGDFGGGSCYLQFDRQFSATDGCGNTAVYIQQIDNSLENFVGINNPPTDATIQADEVIPDPALLPVYASCGYAEVIVLPEVYTATTVTVMLNVYGPCQATYPEYEYTYTVTTPGFFAELVEVGDGQAGEPLPPPVDVATASTNNPYFHFTMVQDTVYGDWPTEPGDPCIAFQVRRLYRTFNAQNEELEAMSWLETYTIYDGEPPTATVPPDVEVATADEVPPFTFTATDNWGVADVVTYEETETGACATGYALLRYVEVTDSCGFVATAVQTVYVDCSTAVPDAPGTAAPELFPNPSNGTITLRAQQVPYQLTIHDMSGRELVRTTVKDPTATVDLHQHLPAGCYTVRFAHGPDQWRSTLVLVE